MQSESKTDKELLGFAGFCLDSLEKYESKGGDISTYANFANSGEYKDWTPTARISYYLCGVGYEFRNAGIKVKPRWTDKIRLWLIAKLLRGLKL